MPDVAAIRAFLEDRHVALATDVAGFVNCEIAPLPAPADDDAARRQAREVLRRLGAEGWLAPIEQQDLRACCLVREALAAASPLADAVFALQALGSTPLLLAGSEETRCRWLGPAIAGEAMAAFAMTEPDAGSDVSAMTTEARRDGDRWILNGTKTLISNGGTADFYTVFAKTDPAQGTRGISCFAVPADAPGLEFVRPLVMSAPHPLGEIAFRDCAVPDGARVGEAGRGFHVGMETLDGLRATVAAAACGMATRALDEAVRHAKNRRQFGKPLAEQQLVRAKIAKMAIDLRAARLLVYQAAREKDAGAERVTLEASIAKAFATEAAQRIVDDAVQIVGGRGILADHPVDRLYRSVRALRIYEGATDIQYLIIAKHVLDSAG